MISIVAIILVRNEDRFLDRVLHNIADFCDRIIVADNGSTDGTPAILDSWRSNPKVEIHRVHNPSESHELIANLADTPTWVFGVDGDELYDPAGLKSLRLDILSGRYQDDWRLVGHTLHCEKLDESNHTAQGFMGPPSRTATKLYNFSLISSWQGCGQRLHGGNLVFHPGFSKNNIFRFFDHQNWDQSGFRCLHMAFVPRSSSQDSRQTARPNVSESYAGGWHITLRRCLTRLIGKPTASSYKRESYRQGPLVTINTTPFHLPTSSSPS